MSVQHTRGNDPFIVETILSSVCWDEYDHERREFDYSNLEKVIKLLKSGRLAAFRGDYSEAVTAALEQLSIPRSEWTVIRSLSSKYFKQVKDAKVHYPLDDKHWIVSIEEKTWEIFLYHLATMTRSESIYSARRIELGSVSVEGRPCRDKKLVELHRRKCTEVAYKILSGR